MHKEISYLVLYSKGGLSYSEAWMMSNQERSWHSECIETVLKKERGQPQM